MQNEDEMDLNNIDILDFKKAVLFLHEEVIEEE